MRRYALISFLSLLFACEEAANDSVNEMMYIDAPSGLRMRDAPSLEATRLDTIPDQTPVVVTDYSGDEMTIEGRSGRWAHVEYNGTRGWVFAGFLNSSAPPPAVVEPGAVDVGMPLPESMYGEWFARDKWGMVISHNIAYQILPNDYDAANFSYCIFKRIEPGPDDELIIECDTSTSIEPFQPTTCCDGFSWSELVIKPLSPDEIFIGPPEQERLMTKGR